MQNKKSYRVGFKHVLYIVMTLGFITVLAQPFGTKMNIPATSDGSIAVNSTINASINNNGKTNAKKKREQESADAFKEAYKVFMHPRCMNCHPSGDAPLQGDDSHIHTQNVTRGPEGKGLYAMKCSNCHQAANTPGENMPPGNPNWHLPPANMKMVFQGKTPAQLAAQFKDRKLTGKTLQELLHHVTEDKLVLGCWDPGEGRTKPPLSPEDFAAKVREWIERGAAVPK
jgi:mono/diheme cytochrome c family protein